MRDLPLLIVAGEFYQAERWAVDAGFSRKDWIYVAIERDILGRRGNRIAFVGEWWKSKLMIQYSREGLCALYGFTDMAGKPT